jgi:hypothetical protein
MVDAVEADLFAACRESWRRCGQEQQARQQASFIGHRQGFYAP